MRLLVDNKIPFFKEYLHKIKNYKELSIEYFTDSELTNNDCIDADALFIRSTTKIDTGPRRFQGLRRARPLWLAMKSGVAP